MSMIRDDWQFTDKDSAFFSENGYHTYGQFLTDETLASCRKELDAMLDRLQPGRDPADIEVIWGGEGVMDASTVDRAAELAAKGVTRLVVPGFLFWGGPEESLARFGEEVVAPLAEV